MGDLISRKTVLEELEKVFIDYKMAWGKRYGGFAEKVPKAIEEIPTKFDIEYVLNLFEKLKEEAEKDGNQSVLETYCLVLAILKAEFKDSQNKSIFG